MTFDHQVLLDWCEYWNFKTETQTQTWKLSQASSLSSPHIPQEPFVRMQTSAFLRDTATQAL